MKNTMNNTIFGLFLEGGNNISQLTAICKNREDGIKLVSEILPIEAMFVKKPKEGGEINVWDMDLGVYHLWPHLNDFDAEYREGIVDSKELVEAKIASKKDTRAWIVEGQNKRIAKLNLELELFDKISSNIPVLEKLAKDGINIKEHFSPSNYYNSCGDYDELVLKEIKFDTLFGGWDLD